MAENDAESQRGPGPRDEIANSPGAPRPKRAYKRPALVSYGAVKQLTHAVSGVGGDFTGMMMMMSDPAVKENVTRVGDHPLGFGLYLFEFKPEFREACGRGRRFGVMADEVERVAPEAVSCGERGFRVVDYARLGVFVAAR